MPLPIEVSVWQNLLLSSHTRSHLSWFFWLYANFSTLLLDWNYFQFLYFIWKHRSKGVCKN